MSRQLAEVKPTMYGSYGAAVQWTCALVSGLKYTIYIYTYTYTIASVPYS